MSRIQIIDYYRMWRARGWRLPFQYFLHNHLFDIKNKTNTHYRLDKENYLEKPTGFDNGVLYMSCPTNEVKYHLTLLERRLGKEFYNYQFIDLGSGKGKSLLIYLKMFKRDIDHTPIGIEYYNPLVDIAKDNMLIMNFKDNVSIYNDDARNFSKYTHTNKLIIFLFNPFGKPILKNILEKLDNYDCVFLFYIDPIYDDTVQKNNFKLIYEKKGYFPNRCVNIYRKV